MRVRLGSSETSFLAFFALSLELAPVSRSFLSTDVLLRALEEFDIGLRKHLLQRVGELGVSDSFHCRDGRCLIEVLDLQGDGVETHHKLP